MFKSYPQAYRALGIDSVIDSDTISLSRYETTKHFTNLRTKNKMHIKGIVKKNIEILYPELSYDLNGIFFKIHKELGRYNKEKQYADAFERELKGKSIIYAREERIIKDEYFTGNITDFIVSDCVIVELKAKKFVTKDDFYQVKRYLISLNKKLGLLVNFRDNFIKTKRVLNNN